MFSEVCRMFGRVYSPIGEICLGIPCVEKYVKAGAGLMNEIVHTISRLPNNFLLKSPAQAEAFGYRFCDSYFIQSAQHWNFHFSLPIQVRLSPKKRHFNAKDSESIGMHIIQGENDQWGGGEGGGRTFKVAALIDPQVHSCHVFSRRVSIRSEDCLALSVRRRS
jgi:hypothetical protein